MNGRVFAGVLCGWISSVCEDNAPDMALCAAGTEALCLLGRFVIGTKCVIGIAYLRRTTRDGAADSLLFLFSIPV